MIQNIRFSSNPVIDIGMYYDGFSEVYLEYPFNKEKVFIGTLTIKNQKGCMGSFSVDCHAANHATGSHRSLSEGVEWLLMHYVSTLKEVPNPGSEEAGYLGCTCAVIDNHYGQGFGPDSENPHFWISEGCPLHGSFSNREKYNGSDVEER